MTDDTAIAIGKRIKERREYLEMSQPEAARPLGMGRSNLAQIESGGVRISAVDLAKLADVLRCPVSYFFGDVVPSADLDETELLGHYRALPTEIKSLALASIRAMAETSLKLEAR
jgi:transcriptional regulator with XRE-family HTH domain